MTQFPASATALLSLLTIFSVSPFARAATPADQNFDAIAAGTESARNGSLTFSGVTYSTNAVNDTLIVETIARVTGDLPSLGTGNGLSCTWWGTNTGTYAQFASANTADNFKIVSYNAEVWAHSSGCSEIYTIKGYDNGTEVASATVNFRVTGVYGTGASAISYNRLTTPSETSSSGDGANSGKLTFTGGAWGNIDRVRMTVADTAPNTILAVSFDLIDFSDPVVPASAPVVGSPTSASVSTTTVTVGGTVTSDGGAAIIERGVVYSVTGTNNNPLIGGTGVTKTSTTGTTGVFTANLSALSASTSYTFKAYATNSVGVSYSSTGTFTTAALTPPIVVLSSTSGLSGTSVMLNGTVDPRGKTTTASFDYGLTTSYGSTASVTLSPANGSGAQSVSAGLAALQYGTTYYFRLVAINADGRVETVAGSVKTWTHHQAWRSIHFNTLVSAGNAADGADPDADGLANLLEYALNLNPAVSNVTPAVLALTGGNMEYSYTSGTQARIHGVQYVVEWTDTLELGSWSTAGVTQSLVSGDAVLQTFKATVPAGSGGKRFLRLRVASAAQ